MLFYILQGSKYEEQLRKRMALIFHKLDDVHRCFRDLDMRRSRSVPELAAEDVLRPYARNLLLKDITWLMTRFSPDGRFRFATGLNCSLRSHTACGGLLVILIPMPMQV